MSPPPPRSTDRALDLSAIRVHALVLADIRPSEGTLVVAHRRSSVLLLLLWTIRVVISFPLGPLSNGIPLLGWRGDPLLTLPWPSSWWVHSTPAAPPPERVQLPWDRCVLGLAVHLSLSGVGEGATALDALKSGRPPPHVREKQVVSNIKNAAIPRKLNPFRGGRRRRRMHSAGAELG